MDFGRVNLGHVAIWVSDLERAIDFYTGLGFKRTHSFTIDGVENVYVSGGDGALQLKYDPDRTTPVAPNRADVDHLAFDVNDADEAFEEAMDLGAAAVVEPTDIPEADAHVAFVEDPEGYTLEFVQPL